MSFPALFAAGWSGALPEVDRGDGPCELCGHVGARCAWAPKATWSAYGTHAHTGEGAICQGCKLLVDGHPPGKSAGGVRAPRWTTRTLATNGVVSLDAQKDQKPLIAEWVNTPGMSVSIADQGQKHIAYRAPVADEGMLSVGFDGQPVVLPRSQWDRLMRLVQCCYRAGALKASLVNARFSHADMRRLTAAGIAIDHVVALERALGHWRHSMPLTLAVWLAQHPPQEGQQR